MSDTSYQNSNWSYQNYGKWPKMYRDCSIKNNPQQSPINIIPDDIIQECQAKCEVILKYKSSKCYLINDHNAIVINYEPGSYIIYQNNWYQLKKAKIHTPSLHTMNGQTYGAEIDLYHYADEQSNSGVVLAIFLNRGPDHGESVDFINQFIHQVPLISTPVEREVEVSDNWNIISLIPSDRTAYVYDGSLPHPPCSTGLKWIVFNQPSTIGMSALKSLTHNIVNNFGPTIRPPMKIHDYSNIYRIPHNGFKLFEERNIITPAPTVDPDTANELLKNPNDNLSLMSNSDPNMFTKFYMDYKKIIRKIVLLFLYTLVVALAIKITKYIIKNDLVNKTLIRTGSGIVSQINSLTQPQTQQQSSTTPAPTTTTTTPPATAPPTQPAKT